MIETYRENHLLRRRVKSLMTSLSRGILSTHSMMIRILEVFVIERERISTQIIQIHHLRLPAFLVADCLVVPKTFKPRIQINPKIGGLNFTRTIAKLVKIVHNSNFNFLPFHFNFSTTFKNCPLLVIMKHYNSYRYLTLKKTFLSFIISPDCRSISDLFNLEAQIKY